jgi:crotonobetainyl-CoA:carnitine CoA-transferase CaiB-like acyl-CoA transferase
MSITGTGEPAKAGVAIVDVLTGVHAAVAILAAVHGGGPTRIEVPLLDSALAGLVNVVTGALITGQEAGRFGNAHPHIVPYEPFRAADGWVAVAAANDGLFRRLAAAIGRPELAERWPTNASRVENREALVNELEAEFAKRTADEWAALLDEAGVPAGKIRGVLEAVEAAAAAGSDPRVTVQHPTAGELQLIGSPIRMDGLRPPQAPPLLGQHTAEVLAEMGVSEDEIAALKARGAVAMPG